MRFFFISLIISSLSVFPLLAQTTYTMSNQTVVACEGILLDSGNGTPAGNYDHNEDYVFTICLPANGTITFFFAALCLEEPYDYLMIYDGASTSAPLLAGPITDVTPPSPIVSSGSCLTISFHSDANVACSGWVAQWQSDITDPTIPQMTLANINPPCNTNTMVIDFDTPIPCDSVQAGNFSMLGQLAQTVVSATPINCVNGTTTSVQVQLSPGLNESGFYLVNYNSVIFDECGNLWDITASDTLVVTDCPLEVDLLASDIALCQGECAEIYADASGGDFLNYSFQWNPPFPNSAGEFQVCPTQTTTYIVTVSDGTNAPPVTDSITITVLPAPQITFPPISICETSSLINLTANPSGGIWQGEGIVDSLLGVFDPSETGAGTFAVTYTDTAGCSVIDSIRVLPVWAGVDIAACPNTSPFQLTGFSPAGGTWSGTNVTVSGIFTPMTTGVYTLTYTTPSGCTDIRNVNVANIALTDLDTLCESDPPFQLTFTPLGGTWSGVGFTNTYWGDYLADAAGDGFHVLTYDIYGCSDSIDVFIKDIEVPWGFTACPTETPFLIDPPATPVGGTWSGIGIVNPMTGLFNPALQGNDYIDTMFYNVNGCMDTSLAYVWTTRILKDTVYFCLNDAPMSLDWEHIQNTPWDGIWTGNGVTDPDFPGTFDPAVAGAGTHILHYAANTCEDSVVIIVRANATPQDTSVCQYAPPFALYTLFPNGIWHGTGVIDTLAGIFSAAAAGIGTHSISYLSPDSCLSTMQVEVFPLTPAIITGLASQYCWKDTLITLSANPAGGVFNGAGIVGNTFSPTLAGVGQHLITYQVGNGDCLQNGLAVVNVSHPLEVSIFAAKDTICEGDFTQLTAIATNGGSAAYTYSWDKGLGFGKNKAVNPDTTITYTVIAKDGCSYPDTAEVTIFVYPPFTL
ncbi:MAG: CUB domain-containing protein, partial [Bacteroidia bacterium]